MAVRSYRELKVWQQSMELVKQIYRITEPFPKKEQFGLASQIQRAAVSIPSNIAEGAERESTKDYMRFVNIARGSLAELETQLLIATDLAYIDQEIYELLEKACTEIGRMLHGLYLALKAKLTETASGPLATRHLSPAT